jgi:fructuronate reductase
VTSGRPRLSESVLARSGVVLPYRRDRAVSGIAHLGIGAFHRAHQAVYTDDAMAAGDSGWGITGVSLRSPEVRDQFAPQDALYAVEQRGPGDAERRVIGAINQVLVAPEDPQAVVAALADPRLHIVTLTVTEKGYCRDLAGGGLQLDHPDIAAELAGGAPRTIFGYLGAALERRAAERAGPLTIISCDNLADNGRVLDRLLNDYVDRRGLDLPRDWACPNTMVDRIVPRTSPADLARGDWDDRGLVVTEPYRQWVIEDRFAGPRPRWELGGAQFVDDVHPFEVAKLRLLNGSHSALAYVGLALGHGHVHEAMADPDIAALIGRLMDEAIPTLPPASALRPQDYAASLRQRFGNSALPHRLAQIAMDGSQKIPQRWLATIGERTTRGLPSDAHGFCLAAWMFHVRGRSPEGQPHMVDDPLAEALRHLWDQSASAGDAVHRIIASSGIFAPGFAEAGGLAATLEQWLESFFAIGVRGSLRQLLNDKGPSSAPPLQTMSAGREDE